MDELSPAKRALFKAARVLGGQAAVAKVLGYPDRRNVAPWFATDKERDFPAEHCPVIERETRAVGDVVTCEELRPDVQWNVLREMPAESSGARKSATDHAQARDAVQVRKLQRALSKRDGPSRERGGRSR